MGKEQVISLSQKHSRNKHKTENNNVKKRGLKCTNVN